VRRKNGNTIKSVQEELNDELFEALYDCYTD
jgi:hypothetical protein